MTLNRIDYNSYCVDLPTKPDPGIGRILVTGASGYIGGRLVPELLARNYKVRIMVREQSTEFEQRWPDAEIVAADAMSLEAVEKVLEGVDTVYYLIHSLLLGPREFESADLRAAVNFRKAAGTQTVRRIIYLGGLGDKFAHLSPHLRSRILVAKELARGKVPVTTFRAAIIIGSGSASYEIMDRLVRNLPVIPIPFWARTRCQPISIRDIVKYLVGSLEAPETSGREFDIGGDEILTYEKMMRIIADLLGKKRWFVSSPISNIGLYAYLANLITPVPNAITRCLLESSINEVVCQESNIKKLIPFKLLSFGEAVKRAALQEECDTVHTRWSDAYPPAYHPTVTLGSMNPPPCYMSTYSLVSGKPAAALFKSICSIGGREGWFHSNWLWSLRGSLDRMLTGVGMSRGRRSRSTLRVNDVIDFWRVEDLKENSVLLLRAEMILPGRAWLQFRIEPEGSGNRLIVTAFFDTHTIAGKLYWFVCIPFHVVIFKNLIKQIERRS